MAEFEILAIGLDEADAPAKFAKSFRETGFAIIKDHNISSDEIDRMYGDWTDFFASDEGPSFAVKPGESAGYFGYKSENAKGSANKDLKEFFHAYQNKELPKVTEKETREFQDKLINMGSTLLGWLDQETVDNVSFSEPLENMINGSDMNLLNTLLNGCSGKIVAEEELEQLKKIDLAKKDHSGEVVLTESGKTLLSEMKLQPKVMKRNVIDTGGRPTFLDDLLGEL